MELKVYRSGSASAALVVGHGAGAGQNSPFMVRTAEGLAARGIAAATFDFPYMTARRSVPDRPPVLEQAWRDAITQARRELGGLPLFIGGKSMGGRISSQVASQGVEGVSGLVFLGYPLHPPGKPEQRRDAHLPAINEPMLFVQGSARRVRHGRRDPRSCCRSCSTRRCTKSPAATIRSRSAAAERRSRTRCLSAILDVVKSWIVEQRLERRLQLASLQRTPRPQAPSRARRSGVSDVSRS